MESQSHEREYDLVLLGASGYTGKLTAQYISKSLPLDLKWAVAGRNSKKLTQLVQQLASENPSRKVPDVLTVNLNDDELDRLAKKTRLVISTVGPFLVYGSATFRACALNSTHYLDCTGETPWVADMIRQYDEIAKKNGSIMIPCCGFDCVPSDLSTWVAANHLRQQHHAPTRRVDICIHSLQGGISGGTLASLLQTLNLYSLRQLYHIHAPFGLSPKQPTPSVPPQRSSIWTKTLGLLRIKELGWMGYQPQGPVDRAIVHRSWGLLEPTAASYGHNFDFHAWLRIWGPVPAVLWHLGLAMLVPLLLLRPVRWLLPKLWYQPGEGAGLNKIHGNWFEYRAVAEADTTARLKALVRLRYDGDPYVFTAVVLGEAARVALRRQDTWAHRVGGGVLTPATLGAPYVSQLQGAGVVIEVHTKGPEEQNKKDLWKGH